MVSKNKDLDIDRPGSSISEHQNISYAGSQTCLHGQKAGQKKNQSLFKRFIHSKPILFLVLVYFLLFCYQYYDIDIMITVKVSVKNFNYFNLKINVNERLSLILFEDVWNNNNNFLKIIFRSFKRL